MSANYGIRGSPGICDGCKQPFKKYRSSSRFCSYDCLLIWRVIDRKTKCANPVKCKSCGEIFIRHNNNQIHCTVLCRDQHRRDSLFPTKTRPCTFCGTEFSTIRTLKKYCSRICCTLAHRKRNPSNHKEYSRKHYWKKKYGTDYCDMRILSRIIKQIRSIPEVKRELALTATRKYQLKKKGGETE